MVLDKEELFSHLVEISKSGMVCSLMNSVNKLDNSLSKDDLIMDLYVMLIEDDCRRLRKIRKVNGISFFCVNRLKDRYNKVKTKDSFVKDIRYILGDELYTKLKSIGYNDTEMRIHSYYLRIYKRNINNLIRNITYNSGTMIIVKKMIPKILSMIRKLGKDVEQKDYHSVDVRDNKGKVCKKKVLKVISNSYVKEWSDKFGN